MVKSNSIDLARRAYLVVAFSVLALGVGLVLAQTAAAQNAANDEVSLLSAEALDELVGPIALYPDDLVGIVLPAATYPLQVVQAARFLEARAENSKLEPDPDWDDSVVALLNYPDVVKLMNDDLDWTWELGEAVLNQRGEVLDAIQGFRDRAYAAGNLRSDDRQVVSNDDGVIEITPADPEVIYVPYYEPERVVVYQTRPVFYYHPWAYPVYYYPYPAGYYFSTGSFWGVTSAFTIGWHSHFLHVHHRGFHGHPYYGYHYYDPFYVRRGININVNVNRGYVWEPRYHRAARPFARSDGRRVANTFPLDAGARDPSRYRNSSPDTRSFNRPQQQRDAVITNSNSGRRNPSVEREQQRMIGRTPGTAPRATPRIQQRSDTPQVDTNGNVGGATRQPSQTAPRPRTGGGMSQALERAQPRYNTSRVNPQVPTGTVVRPNVSQAPQAAAPRSSGQSASQAPQAAAPRSSGQAANGGGQSRYRSETSASNDNGARATPHGNQNQPLRGARSNGRQSSR